MSEVRRDISNGSIIYCPHEEERPHGISIILKPSTYGGYDLFNISKGKIIDRVTISDEDEIWYENCR